MCAIERKNGATSCGKQPPRPTQHNSQPPSAASQHSRHKRRQRTAPRPEPAETEQSKSVRELFEAMDALKDTWGTIPPKTPEPTKVIVAIPELNADELIADIEAMLSGI